MVTVALFTLLTFVCSALMAIAMRFDTLTVAGSTLEGMEVSRMSDELDSFGDRLEAALLSFVRDNLEGTALVTGWVLVAEVMDEDGNPDLAAFASDGMPYWKINGLLDAAPDAMAYDYEDEDEES